MSQAPTGADKTIVLDEDGSHVFTSLDFGFQDADDDAFLAVIITTLPLGSLTLNGIDVTAWQRIDVADLGNLVWNAPENEFGLAFASIGFQVVDNSGQFLADTDLSPNWVNFDLTPLPDAPESADTPVVVYQGETRNFDGKFNGWDPDGDDVIGVEISQLPGVGILLFDGLAVDVGQFIAVDAYSRLTWTPPEGVVAESIATIGFRAVSNGGVNGREVDPTPGYLTISLKSAPLGQDMAFDVPSEGYHTFSAIDFGFSDYEGDAFVSIEIFEIDGGGILTLNGDIVQVNDRVVVADFEGLRWTPTGAGYGTGAIKFQVVDSGDGLNMSNIDKVPRTMTFNEVAANSAPLGANQVRTILEDATYTFSASDFGFADADLDDFAGVKIVTLPATGLLKLNGASVSAGAFVQAADLGVLTWTPAKDAYGAALGVFTFRVVDDGGTNFGGVDTDPTARSFTFNVSSVLETYLGTSGADRLNGIQENDTFYGLAGNDTIDGKAGADTMIGGLHNDIYIVDRITDRVVELAGQGTDTVRSSVSWTLGANAENVTLLNIATAKNATGNALANTLAGNGLGNVLAGGLKNDVLQGFGGADTLNGQAGNDRLLGGAGRDVFVFDQALSAANRDIISDFRAVDDTIHLQNAVFRKLAKVGLLSKDFFKLSTQAKDANDYIIYNKASGALLYDADGSGKAAAVQFATLSNHVAITSADFVVI